MLTTLVIGGSFFSLLYFWHLVRTRSKVLRKILGDVDEPIPKRRKTCKLDYDLSVVILLDDIERDKLQWYWVFGVESEKDVFTYDHPAPSSIGFVRKSCLVRGEEYLHLYVLVSVAQWKKYTKLRQRFDDVAATIRQITFHRDVIKNTTEESDRLISQRRIKRIEEEAGKTCVELEKERADLNEQLKGSLNSFGKPDFVIYGGVCEGLKGDCEIGQVAIADRMFYANNNNNYDLRCHSMSIKLKRYVLDAESLDGWTDHALPGFEPGVKVGSFLGENLKPTLLKNPRYYKAFCRSAFCVSDGEWLFESETGMLRGYNVMIVKCVNHFLGEGEEEEAKKRRALSTRLAAAWTISFLDDKGVYFSSKRE